MRSDTFLSVLARFMEFFGQKVLKERFFRHPVCTNLDLYSTYMYILQCVRCLTSVYIQIGEDQLQGFRVRSDIVRINRIRIQPLRINRVRIQTPLS